MNRYKVYFRSKSHGDVVTEASTISYAKRGRKTPYINITMAKAGKSTMDTLSINPKDQFLLIVNNKEVNLKDVPAALECIGRDYLQ